MTDTRGDPARFLMALGQAVATAGLYAGDHPARTKAADVMFAELQNLLHFTSKPRYTFLGEEVVFGRMALRSLKDWSLGPRLSRAGIQWLELTDAVTAADLRAFIEDVISILATPAEIPIDPLLFQRSGIKWGMVSVKRSSKAVSETPPAYGDHGLPARSDSSQFTEEVETTRWITTRLDEGSALPLAEAQAVIRSLAIALHQHGDVLQPLHRLGTSERDASVHSVGVAILAMRFAEYLGMSASDVRAIGVAALFHDVGLTAVPAEILARTSELAGDELAEYQKHTEHGARILLGSERQMSLAAIVAYEHHMRPDGTGYPRFRVGRDTHKASRMIRICSSYHSRRSNKPYRAGMDGMAVLSHIEWHAGKKYDAELSAPFVMMMREEEKQLGRNGLG